MKQVSPIQSVAIVGDGLTAWSCAAALKRRVPSLEIKLIRTAGSPAGLADQMISTLPSAHRFHTDIGLSDEDTIVRAKSWQRLGTLFSGWAADSPAYVHAYSPYGAPIEGVPFHQLWLRERRRSDLPPFDRFSQAVELALAGRAPDPAFHDCQTGLQLSLELYSTLIRDYALHLEVIAREPALKEVTIRSTDGFIDCLLLEDGTRELADLFVDCTGPAAVLHSLMNAPVVDWSSWLPCDRIMATRGPSNRNFGLLDQVTAVSAGWSWSASSPQTSVMGLAYHSAFADDVAEEVALLEGGEVISLHSSRKQEFWVRNCVAIGDAAISLEPLEWTNLHLVHKQIDRLISMLPGSDCAPVELVEFNRQCAEEADRVRDFICLHYICSRRPEPFWKEASAMTPPSSLAHTLSLFAERGRLPFYEEETFARDSWLAVLLGQGFEPQHIDPLTDVVPCAVAERALVAMRRTLTSFTFHPPGSTLTDLNPRGVR